MLTNEEKLLMNELKAYNYLLQKYADMTDNFAKSLKGIDDRIHTLDIQLNEYHIPAINYDSIKNTSIKNKNRILELIHDQENLITRRKEMKNAQMESLEKIIMRIEDIDEKLYKLNNWERQFITHMCIESRYIEYMCDTYNCSIKTVYRKRNSILKKMLK
jgi:hypothetical protein